MHFRKFTRMLSLLLCIIMLGTLVQVKEASASRCYDHSKQKTVVTKQPTCTKTGTREYRCKTCGYLVKTETIPAKGHSVSGQKKTVNATCTSSGYTAIICNTCGVEVSRSTISALGHSWGSWSTTKSATCTASGTKTRKCTRCGKTETSTISATGHSWGSWTTTKNATCTAAGSKQRKCSKCGQIETASIAALGHNVQGQTRTVSATCTKDGYTAIVCSRCGQEMSKTVIKAGHKWGDWVTDKAAGCETDGSKHRNCTVCGARETATIAKLGHNVQGQKKTVAPTCTKDGYTAIICSRCGKEVSKVVTTAPGHKWGSWVIDKQPVCGAQGERHRSCTVCGATQKEKYGESAHMSLTPKTVDATCGKDGYKAMVCSRCGKEVSRTVIPATGEHTWGTWVVDKAPTCTADGSRHRVCKVCGANETSVIKSEGHKLTGQTKTVPSTCLKAGYTVNVCSACGAEVGEKKQLAIPAHKWSNWVVDKEATCEADGVKHRTCNVCGTTEKTTIAKLGHLNQGKIKTVAATCGKEGYKVVICSRCGKEIGSRTVIPATGNHTWGAWVTDKAPTCSADGEKHRTCSTCGTVGKDVIKSEGHNFKTVWKTVDATCGKDGYKVLTCAYCGKEVNNRTVIPATGNHTWGSWITDKAATCEADGSKHRVCSVCKKTDTQKINKLGHNVSGQTKTVAATCSKDGYKAVICNRCGKEMSRTVIPATGNHTWGSWVVDKAATCEEDGSRHHVCSVCKKSVSEKINKLGHNVQGQIKTVAATCVKNGYRAVVCSRCGKEMGNRTTLPARGHEWGAWVTDKAATCEEDGSKHRKCLVCGTTDTVKLTKLGHNVQGQIRRIEPTCGTLGRRVVVCSRCGKEMGSGTPIPATGNHTWGNWIVDKSPNTNEEGVQHRVCQVCGKTETQMIPRVTSTPTPSPTPAPIPAPTPTPTPNTNTTSSGSNFWDNWDDWAIVIKIKSLISMIEALDLTELDLLQITPTQLKELILTVLSQDFDPDEHYAYNRNHNDAATAYISDQCYGNKADMKVGDRTLREVGCGIVAIHNAIYFATGRNVSLPDIIYCCENNGYVWGLPVSDETIAEVRLLLDYMETVFPGEQAWVDDIEDKVDLFEQNQLNKVAGCGVNPNYVSTILQRMGPVSSTKYTSATSFLTAVNNAVGKENKGFILVVWNDASVTGGAHYIFFRTSKDSNKIIGYNDGSDISSNATYQDVVDRLGTRNREFYAAYEIDE